MINKHTEESLNALIISSLNIHPNKVERMETLVQDENTVIYLTLKADDGLCCPHCHYHNYRGNGFYTKEIQVDKSYIRDIRLFIRVRRYRCNKCDRSFSDSGNISPTKGKLSYKMIFNIMELLKNPKMTFKGVSELLGVSESTVVRTFDSHCHINRLPLSEVMCIDEVYTKINSYDSKYSCLFYDFFNQKIIDVLPCRRKHYLTSYLLSIDKAEKEKVHTICTDLYEPYRLIIHQHFSKSVHCVDSFHVVKHICDDLDKIRIRVVKSYDSSSLEYYLLKRFKYLLFDKTINLDNEPKYNKKVGMYINYRGLLDMMLSIHIDLYEGYYLKESYLVFNQKGYEEAEQQYDSLKNDFIKASIKEFDEFISILNNWKEEILNSFILVKGRRINNGIAESINQNVSALIYNTKGIRNNERRRKRIMYAINKEGFIIR